MPEHVLKVLKALPEGTHPMTQFAQGILALQVRIRGRQMPCAVLGAGYCACTPALGGPEMVPCAVEGMAPWCCLALPALHRRAARPFTTHHFCSPLISAPLPFPLFLLQSCSQFRAAYDRGVHKSQ